MQSLPYLRKNRVGVYSLRFSVQNYPKHEEMLHVKNRHLVITYRQITASLGVRSIVDAKRIYFAVIGEALLALEAFKQGITMSSTMNTYYDNLQELKATLNQLIECASSDNKTSMMANLYAWRVKQAFHQQVEETEKLKSQNQHLAHEKAQTQSMVAAFASTQAATRPPATSSKHKLIDEMSKYFEHKKPDWKSRTAAQAKQYLVRFVEIIGFDKPTEDITSDDVERYYNLMFKLPKNIRKGEAYSKLITSEDKAKYWAELGDKNTKKTLLPAGVESHFTIVRGFLQRLHLTSRAVNDFTAHLKISAGMMNKSKNTRSQFDREAINTIFGSYIYSNHLRRAEKPKSFHFWAPLIAIYSGMRVAEIAALEVTDIIEVEGVKCFDVNKHWSDKQLKASNFDKTKKNKDSIRRIPIHPALWDAGLKLLINNRKTGLLFDDLTLNESKGLGNMISRWFNEYFSKYIELPKYNKYGEQQVFHSFRHTFITAIDSTMVNDAPIKGEVANYLSGHSSNTVRSSVYNHGHNIQYMKAFVDSIDYDLPKLSYSRFLKRTKSPSVRKAR